MGTNKVSKPLALSQITIKDSFWQKYEKLARKEVIPYQWEALNDRVKDAAPSFCIRNFQVAARINREKKEKGELFKPTVWPLDTFETLPRSPEQMEERFYGMLFQDSDLYKWLEAVSYSLMSQPDPELEAIADEAILLVKAAQLESGYLNTYYIINDLSRIFTNLRDNHELYCFGHLTEAAVAYYQATQKDDLLKIAMRFADYLDGYFGHEAGKCKGYPGHEVAEMALVRLYEVTGEERYLRLGAYFIEQRGQRPYYFDMEHPEVVKPGLENDIRHAYHQAHLPVREQKEALGHSVRAVYLYAGMADIARVTADETLLAACEDLWKNITEQKMYITGGIGSTHMGEAFSYPYDLPADTAYAETCAAIGLVFFARRMLENRPDSRYADVMERALFNGVLSGMSLDGKSFFYVNPLEVLPEACHRDERKFHVKPTRQKWFGCACCPPNLARLLTSIGSYAYTANADTFFVHLYIGGEIKNEFAGQEVDIKVESGFPWNGEVAVTVKTPKPSSFTLALRIPGFVFNKHTDLSSEYPFSLSILETDGKMDRITSAQMIIEDGYLYLEREWHDEVVIKLNFPMQTDFIVSNRRVRESIGKVAVMRGPLVYCLEEVDNGSDLHLVSLPLSSLREESEDQHSLFSTYICGQEMTFIRIMGTSLGNDMNKQLYQRYKPPIHENVTLTFVPYFAWNNRGEGEMTVWCS
ncbi:MAG: glycoside hydrolase family 127 protein [Lachnospiraceae bacterium]|jgi:DUF1680 family protein|nr:glycoside hydrolase family 127 protein [Lachnospiraceae bacterium]